MLAGKYRIEHPLGSGGMGTVVAATHLGLGRKVALKFMRVGVLDGDEAMGRFMREARAAATLRSEHVAQVLDVEVDGEDGSPYIVMEHLEGSDLATVLQAGGVPPVRDAVGWVLQACEGLAEAHARGIIHRDLKPANLFLTRRPDGTPLVKVLDFGVSKLTEAAQSGSFQITQPRRTVGSPQYMSPEQMVAATEVDARADVWALGVILYELLTGAPPFAAPTFLELCLEVTNRPHPPLARRAPALPAGLVATVDRCLQKAPAARFPHLAALAEALVPHASPDATLCAERIAGTLGVARTHELPAVARARGRRRTGLVAGALLAGALVTAGALWRRPAPPPLPRGVPAGADPASGAQTSVPAPSNLVPPPRARAAVVPPARAQAAVVPPERADVVPPERAPAPAPKAAAHRSTAHHRRVVPSVPVALPADPPDAGATTRTRRGPVVTDI